MSQHDHGESAESIDPLPTRLRRWWRRLHTFPRKIFRRFKPEPSLRSSLEEMIEEPVEEQPESSFSKEERALLANILKLREKTVDQVMVKHANIMAVEVSTPLDEAAEQIIESKHSRVPIYQTTIDHVIGIVNIKDVIAELNRNGNKVLLELARQPRAISPSLPVLDLLFEMRQSRQHMALVVDEFGGIDGLVTIEDLIEEIVGEIEDEYDERSVFSIVERADGSLTIDARLPVRDFEAHLQATLPERESEDSETMSSVVLALAGRIPARGELLLHPSGLEFEITEADLRRVKVLKVRNLRAIKP